MKSKSIYPSTLSAITELEIDFAVDKRVKSCDWMDELQFKTEEQRSKERMIAHQQRKTRNIDWY